MGRYAIPGSLIQLHVAMQSRLYHDLVRQDPLHFEPLGPTLLGSSFH